MDLMLRLLAQEVMRMGLGLAPEVALSVTRTTVSRLAADAKAGRPPVALKAAVLDEVWRRQAVCAVEVAATLQPGDGMGQFAARLRLAYERVVGYVWPAEKVPQLLGRLVRDGVLVVADGDGRWNVSPAARKAAGGMAPAGEAGTVGTDVMPLVAVTSSKTRSRAALAASAATRRALVEADLLAYPADTVAARARRLGPQLGLKDRAARGRISALVGELRTAM